jgi:hypothetical protein
MDQKVSKEHKSRAPISVIVRGRGVASKVADGSAEPSFFSDIPFGEGFYIEKESLMRRVMSYLKS